MAKRDTLDGVGPAQIKALMSELALSGPLSIERVARHLGSSPRTLQRKLLDEGLTFRSIVDAVRLDMAKILLTTTDLTVSEISTKLGYQTASGFTRAFSRWTGQAPSEYRHVFKFGSSRDASVARNGTT